MNKIAELMNYFDHPKAGISERIELDIKRHRTGWGTLTITDHEGKPVCGRTVKFRQLSHDFRFGCNGFKAEGFPSPEQNEQYAKRFSDVFNEAVVPFYWDAIEPRQGMCRYAKNTPQMDRRPQPDLMLDWCRKWELAPKGHWLLCDNFVPGWLPKDSRQFMALLEERIAYIGEHYGKQIVKWDVTNESCSHHPRKTPKIGDATLPRDYVYETFKMAEKYFPRSTEFIINEGSDVGFLWAFDESSLFYLLAERLLRRGVKLDALGIQFHMFHSIENLIGQGRAGYFNPAHILKSLDQYARLGLGLHISEISLPSFPELAFREADELQARMVREFYRTWFSHPACQSIVYWNLCDGTAYGTEGQYRAGLLNPDLSPKLAYLELDRLVNREWHTECTAVTDGNGQCNWNGYYGEYEVKLDGEKTFTLDLNPRNENEFSFFLNVE